MTGCYRCGDDDHYARDCPSYFLAEPGSSPPSRPASGRTAKPPWCGTCDERTRLIELTDERMARCKNCHPLAHHELAQHRKCPACHQRVYQWDAMPCGSHRAVA